MAIKKPDLRTTVRANVLRYMELRGLERKDMVAATGLSSDTFKRRWLGHDNHAFNLIDIFLMAKKLRVSPAALLAEESEGKQ